VLAASIIIALMIEAESISETLVNFYQTTQRKSQKTVIFILSLTHTHIACHGIHIKEERHLLNTQILISSVLTI
jgi:hypothetical protein